MLMLLFCLGAKGKTDELVFKNKGFVKLLCAVNEMQRLIKKQTDAILYITNVLM